MLFLAWHQASALRELTARFASLSILFPNKTNGKFSGSRGLKEQEGLKMMLNVPRLNQKFVSPCLQGFEGIAARDVISKNTAISPSIEGDPQ